MEKILNKEFGNVITRNMEEYANEVNTSRAIPSVIDGLKPVQRRILYDLYRGKGKKEYIGCAMIVGSVLGNWHPHGDSAAYGALTRMANPYIMSTPLIDFHGNVGDLVNPPAAMRYTKAKLGKYGAALLSDIEIPNCVEWQPNYSETLDEPKYLCGTLGTLNLLINPQISIGLAVGANWTCHRLADILPIVKYRIEHPSCSFEDLPPLYPSYHNSGVIVNKSEIPNIYKTGKGSVILRSKYHWEDNVLFITELPYRVAASKVKESLVKHPITGIEEIFETNTNGLKIYCSDSVDHTNLENQLFRKTQIQMRYSINMTALDINGRPKLWTLLELIDLYIEFQHRRISAIAEYNKQKFEHSKMISEGLVAALDIIDEVVSIIKTSDTVSIAAERLKDKLNINDEQVKAILDMRLGKLTKMDKPKILSDIQHCIEEVALNDEIIKTTTKREQMMLNDLGAITDLAETATECIDEVTEFEVSHITSSASYLLVNGECEFNDGTVINADDDLVFVTNYSRGVVHKVSEFGYGTYKIEDVISKPKDGERLVSVFVKRLLSPTITILNEDGSEKTMNNIPIAHCESKTGAKLFMFPKSIAGVR